MIGSNILVDGRAIQVGYKRHWVRGIGSYARSLLGALGGSDDRLSWTLLFDERFASPEPLPPGFAAHSFRTPGVPLLRRPVFSNALFLAGALRSARADAFLFPSHEDAPPSSPGAPTIVVVHDCIPYLRPSLYGWSSLRTTALQEYARRVLSYSSIISISNNTKKDLVDMFRVDPGRVAVIHPGLDQIFVPPGEEELARYRRSVGLTEPYLLALGGSDPRKNIARAVEAWDGAVRRRSLDCRFVLVGPRAKRSWEEPLGRAIASCAHPERVVRIDRVRRDDLPLLYGGARGLLFVSLYEGFGLPALEAMGCGTPVIASRTSSVPEVTGSAALLVDPIRVDEMAEAIAALLADSSLAQRLARDGRERAARFSWAESADRVRAVVREALKKDPREAHGA